jgi:hypothetical protein
MVNNSYQYQQNENELIVHTSNHWTQDYDICIAHVHKKIEKQLLNLVNVPKPV